MEQGLIEFVQNYGYWAVLLGSFVEGESVILTASAMAYAGHLDIIKVMLVAFIGTLIADQLLFFLGYFYGPRTINWVKNRFPKSAPYIEKALKFLEKYQTLYILSFRFIWGIRIISSVIIGAQKVSFLRFTFLNCISAIVWSVLSCSVGYFLGGAFSYLKENYGSYVTWGILGIIVLSVLCWKLKKRRTRDR